MMKYHFQIIGNIGACQKLKEKEAVAPLIISIASNENYKDREGNWQQKTIWNDVFLFGEMAERILNTYYIGSLVLVEGTLSKRSYQKEDGRTHYTTSLVAKSIKLLFNPASSLKKDPIDKAFLDQKNKEHTSPATTNS